MHKHTRVELPDGRWHMRALRHTLVRCAKHKHRSSRQAGCRTVTPNGRQRRAECSQNRVFGKRRWLGVGECSRWFTFRPHWGRRNRRQPGKQVHQQLLTHTLAHPACSPGPGCRQGTERVGFLSGRPSPRLYKTSSCRPIKIENVDVLILSSWRPAKTGPPYHHFQFHQCVEKNVVVLKGKLSRK